MQEADKKSDDILTLKNMSRITAGLSTIYERFPNQNRVLIFPTQIKPRQQKIFDNKFSLRITATVLM